MSRSLSFDNLMRVIRIGDCCEFYNVPAKEALERTSLAASEREQKHASRREFLAAVGKLAAVGAMGSFAGSLEPAFAAPRPRQKVAVGIVGAGLAGLACADTLRRNGITAMLYDAADRVGGRCWSLRNFFPGQVAERGGEFIDNLHKTMLGYAREFKLALEDVEKQPGDVVYFFGGQQYPESTVVDEYRALVAAVRADLRTLSNEPTADEHTAADVALDQLSLREYLETRGAGSVIKAAIEQAYEAEYGLAIDRQSCLNFLLFIHADKRSKFRPLGVFSDERYHVIDGNDRIAAGIAGRLQSQIQLGMRLEQVLKTAGGRVELNFAQGAASKSVVFDAVVLAVPFATLRDVALDASLLLPAETLAAIHSLGYGTNAKMMLGFNGRPWSLVGSSGESYSNLANHQTTWETNPARANGNRAVLTDYSSGERGAGLNPGDAQGEAALFLNDLDRVYPGSTSAAARDPGGNFRVHIEHWPSNPLSRGSYTCYLPGQFTSIAGNEGKPVDNLYFAGEHANSFYEWQGFMEGACRSGIQVAQDIVKRLRISAPRATGLPITRPG